MKKKLMLIIFYAVIIIAVCSPVSSSESAEKVKIGIMEFDVAKNLDPAFGDFLYDMLLERMVASGKYTVVDWKEIDRLLKYIEQSQPNISEDEARKQAMNQKGIQKMYVGSLTKIGGKYYVTVKVLNLDLTVEKVQKGSTKSEGDLETCINEIADNLLGLAKESKEQQAAGKARRGRLFVETEPKGARVRILNIKPKFQQGIELEPGSYHVEVSASDYATQNVWIILSAGEDKTVMVRLTEATASNVLQQAIGFYIGTAGHVDEKKARMLFLEASEKDDPLARMWVARLYHKGRCGFPGDEARAKEMAERVIKQVKSLTNEGNTEAMFLLASAYDEGLAIAEDHVQAVYWYRKAAEKGDASAMNSLGWMYEQGKGVAKDEAQAVYWFRKVAEKGEATAMTNLGWMYEQGKGVAKDAKQAVYWYRKAAEKGYSPAAKRLKGLGY